MAAERVEEDDHHPVFVPVSLLPHHDDHPMNRHKTHESHIERHRNTSDYVADHHSPVTNRKNAGILLRRVSDDFNARKFPDLLEMAKKKRRTHSESDIGDVRTSSGQSRPLTLLRRLSQSAIGPATPTPRSQTYPVLPEEDN